MSIEIEKNNKYKRLVNFKRNYEEPIHRWFEIKEGYSRELIIGLIKDLKINRGYIVDFFNGSGTTSLVAKEQRMKYYGFEVNPFLHLLSKVKLADYSHVDVKRIKKKKSMILKDYNKINNVKVVKLSILEKVFKENLNDILKIRTSIINIENERIRSFFMIAMLSILNDVGYAKKDGNGLKYPKNKKVHSFIDRFSEKIDLMIDDISLKYPKNKKDSYLIMADSRNIPREDYKKIKNKASLIVFSPPYANCFDYSEVYKLETWLSGYVEKYEDLSFIRNNSLSSHLNKDLSMYGEYSLLANDLNLLKNKKMWSNKILKMLSGYFFDMEKILNNSFKILRKEGCCVVVVGNSAYSGHIIKTDEIIAKIGQKIGFSNIKINIARKLRASSQQAKLLKNGNGLRESVIIMKKTK